jgi:hypothetical protein
MAKKSEYVDKTKNEMSGFDYVAEVFGWLQILASPLLISLVFAAFVYFPNPNGLRLFISFIIIATGLIIGIVFASRAWRKNGTMHFMSRVNASPELDDVEEQKK